MYMFLPLSRQLLIVSSPSPPPGSLVITTYYTKSPCLQPPAPYLLPPFSGVPISPTLPQILSVPFFYWGLRLPPRARKSNLIDSPAPFLICPGVPLPLFAVRTAFSSRLLSLRTVPHPFPSPQAPIRLLLFHLQKGIA